MTRRFRRRVRPIPVPVPVAAPRKPRPQDLFTYPPDPLPEGGPARLTYFVCTTQRTGSWFLCHALRATGVAGAPAEYFYPGIVAKWRERVGVEPSASYRGYVSALLTSATTANGVFGAKIMWHYMPALRSRIGLLEDWFPSPRYVFLQRADRAAQAVSFWRADQTDEWVRGARPVAAPPYDFEAILKQLRVIEVGVWSWRAWFDEQRISPVELLYEDVVADHASAVRSVLAALDIDPTDVTMPRPELRQQADGASATLRARFIEELGYEP